MNHKMIKRFKNRVISLYSILHRTLHIAYLRWKQINRHISWAFREGCHNKVFIALIWRLQFSLLCDFGKNNNKGKIKKKWNKTKTGIIFMLRYFYIIEEIAKFAHVFSCNNWSIVCTVLLGFGDIDPCIYTIVAFNHRILSVLAILPNV